MPARVVREFSSRGIVLSSCSDTTKYPKCMDCLRFNDSYMVRSAVWHEATEREEGSDGDGLLCFECLELRLGRSLKIEDFLETAPINRGVLLGYHLAKESTPS